MADDRPSLSGLTSSEAQEFHRYFMQGFIIWIIVSAIAHLLVWFWRPWFPGAGSDTAMIDNLHVLQSLTPFIG